MKLHILFYLLTKKISNKSIVFLLLILNGYKLIAQHDESLAFKTVEHVYDQIGLGNYLVDLGLWENYARNEPFQKGVDSLHTSLLKNLQEKINLDHHFSNSELAILKVKFLDCVNKEYRKNKSQDSSVTIPVKQWDGPCVNMDFEEGTLNGWEMEVGQVTPGSQVPYSFMNGVPVSGGSSHLLVTGGVDPMVGIPMLNPNGGSYSVRLGNGTASSLGAARISQSFLVTPSNQFFTYSYAVVIEDGGGGHSINQQPYFSVRVYDESGQNINCGEYSVAVTSSISGFQHTGTVYYKDWTTVFTNLAAYIGQNVTIEFTSGDCTLGAHYGYAYIDASCSTQEISVNNPGICPGQDVELTAPPGNSSYLWNTGDTTQTISVSIQGNYSCQLIPAQGSSCSITLDVDILELIGPEAGFYVDTLLICKNDQIQFYDTSYSPSPVSLSTLTWDFGDSIITPESADSVAYGSDLIVGVDQTSGIYQNPVHIYDSAGVFNAFLIVKSENGCTDTANVQLQVLDLPEVSAGTDSSICRYVEPIDLVGLPAGGQFYGTGLSNNMFDPASGTQLLFYTYSDSNGCTNTDSVLISVYSFVAADAGTYTAVCPEAADVQLNGTPGGGVFTGAGVVSGNFFDPSSVDQLVIYAYTDSNGCIISDSTVIPVFSSPDVLGGELYLCEGNPFVAETAGAVNYQWSGGLTNGEEIIPVVGTSAYTVVGTDANGCVDTAEFQLHVAENPVSSILADSVSGFPGLLVTFSNASTNASQYYWDLGDGAMQTTATTNDFLYVYMNSGIYYAVLVAENDWCLDTSSVLITILPFPDPVIEVPNVFTPNGDNNNDLFFLNSAYLKELKVIVVNRWGELIAELQGVDATWNGESKGKEVSDGVYFYKYEAEGLNGKDYTGHGNITLIR